MEIESGKVPSASSRSQLSGKDNKPVTQMAEHYLGPKFLEQDLEDAELLDQYDNEISEMQDSNANNNTLNDK